MSLGIAFKGPEGIVLAADSRVTLYHPLPGQNVYIPATYDNATKLLHPLSQRCLGVVTYGLGTIGQTEFRTAHSLFPELDDKLPKTGQMPVKEFAQKLSDFFMERWKTTMPLPPDYKGIDMCFFVAGYDLGQTYGRLFWLSIPTNPNPIEFYENSFGIVFDGQREFADRLIRGYDSRLIPLVKDYLKLNDDDAKKLDNHLLNGLNIQIPIQFLTLQDCVDLSIFLIKATIMMQTWVPMIRGVGGAIDVAIITREDGFQPVQEKHVTGDKPTLKLENIGGN